MHIYNGNEDCITDQIYEYLRRRVISIRVLTSFPSLCSPSFSRKFANARARNPANKITATLLSMFQIMTLKFTQALYSKKVVKEMKTRSSFSRKPDFFSMACKVSRPRRAKEGPLPNTFHPKNRKIWFFPSRFHFPLGLRSISYLFLPLFRRTLFLR